MSEAAVRSICAEFEIEIIPANEYPKPGQTRALSTLTSIFQKFGDGHIRIVLSTLLETKGNQGLMTAPILWATSDLVEACSEWIEKDLSDWYQAWDKIPVGWITWHCQSLYGIVSVRQAAAGAMYVMLRYYSMSKAAGKPMNFSFLKRTGDVEDQRLFKQVPAAKAIEAGRVLLDVKAALSPKEFRVWLRENIGMSTHTATSYMKKVAAITPQAELPSQRKRTSKEMATIGMECLMMKATLPRGLYGAWLKSECPVTQSAASSYMRIANVYGDRDDMLDGVQATGLLLLVQRSTPAFVRLRVERLVAAGNFVTLEKIKLLTGESPKPMAVADFELAA